MKRCDLCYRRIWPWQEYGHTQGFTRLVYWHRRCIRQWTAGAPPND